MSDYLITRADAALRHWEDTGRHAEECAPILFALIEEVKRLRQEWTDFTSRLGFGDNVEEPAAELRDIVDTIEAAFAEARDHMECPRLCESCGLTLANQRCEHCHGSGCHNVMSANYGAYVECEWCAGSGWVHPGCPEAKAGVS